jgi:hypothetical protein
MSTQSERRAAERRRIARQKSFLRGMIYFNNRRSVVDCLIRDITAYGARLTFSAAITAPDVLELHVPQKEQTLRSHVIWRHGRELGVAFAPATDTEHPAGRGGLADRVRRLEADVTALKRQFKQIKSDTVHAFEPD